MASVATCMNTLNECCVMLHDNFVTRPNKVTVEDILAIAPRSNGRQQFAVRLASEDLTYQMDRMRSNDQSERWGE